MQPEKAVAKPASRLSSLSTKPESTSFFPVARSMRRISSISERSSSASARSLFAMPRIMPAGRSARGLAQAGVDHQDVAADPARLVAREVDRAPADVPGGAFDAERRGAPAPLARLGPEALDHRRPHLPRCNGVDADALRSELYRNAGDEADHPCLRCGVRGAAMADHGGDGRDAGNRAA